MMTMRDAFIESTQKQAIEVVKSGRIVVLLGVQSDRNLPPELRTHPQIIAWQSDNGLHKKSLPANAGLVLMSRFMTHEDKQKFARAARAAGVPCDTAPHSTGTLRNILWPLKDIRLEEQETTPMPALKKVAKFGELRDFVETNADLDAANLAEESRRLLPIAHDAGITSTTPDSIRKAIDAAKMRRAIAPPPSTFHLDLRPPTPTPALAPPEPPAPSSSPAPMLDSDERDVMRLFDDAISAMQLARERFTLLLERQKGSAVLKQQLLELANRL